MPSPFPGMDPFIEGQEWEDFHHECITAIRGALMPQVVPHYVVRVDRYVYIDYVSVERADRIRPDAFVLEAARSQSPAGGSAATAPVPEEQSVAYLTVREPETMEVVTVIELLSPVNKRSNSDGRREYLRKREAVLKSNAHLVELDLLRGGERLPTIEPVPPADFYAFVCREPRRPRAEVYPWSLRQPLPTVPVPLKGNDPDVPLDLQTIFTTVYDQARYDISLDYRRPVAPPLSEEDAAWAQQLLKEAAA